MHFGMKGLVCSQKYLRKDLLSDSHPQLLEYPTEVGIMSSSLDTHPHNQIYMSTSAIGR